MRTRTHPGEVLRLEFMDPASISLDQASRRMGLRIDTLNLQRQHDNSQANPGS